MTRLIRASTLALAVLLIYWAAMFIGTHLPAGRLPAGTPRVSDKTIHFTGYFGLAFLCALVRFKRQRASAAQVAALFAGLAIYAAFDELSQIPIPGRTADWNDWIADMAGVAAGLAVFFPVRCALGVVRPAALPQDSAAGSNPVTRTRQRQLKDKRRLAACAGDRNRRV